MKHRRMDEQMDGRKEEQTLKWFAGYNIIPLPQKVARYNKWSSIFYLPDI